MNKQLHAAGIFAAMLLPVAAGCGDVGNRAAVSGTVKVDSVPLAAGRITFEPLEAGAAPQATAEIVQGRYELGRAAGPGIGRHRVLIHAADPLPAPPDDPEAFLLATSAGRNLPKNSIPPKYNRDSQESVEVSNTAPNEFNYDLVLDHKR